MKDTKLDGLSFNTDHILTFKSEAEWLEYCEANMHWYEGQSSRIDKLKAVYAMANGVSKDDIEQKAQIEKLNEVHKELKEKLEDKKKDTSKPALAGSEDSPE